jgi:hypothetical protein
VDTVEGETESALASRPPDNPTPKVQNQSEELSQSNPIHTPIVSPNDLVGRIFQDTINNKEYTWQVVQLNAYHERDIQQHPDLLRFIQRCSDASLADEILSYGQLMNKLFGENEILWSFDRIITHQGPLSKRHPDYKGNPHNVVVAWSNRDQSLEPLHLIASDNPVSCALYARDNQLLDLPGWRRFRGLAKRSGKILREVNLAKSKSFSKPKFNYGVEAPRNYKHAIEIDHINGNTLWQDAIALELGQIDGLNTFKYLGHQDDVQPP